VIIDVPDFLTLRQQLPLVDVRSENEFQQGHIPAAINIPILNNEERVIVGTTYKQNGQLAAIKEGFRLVGPRLASIIDQAQSVGKEFIVHCWRGGMRSGNFCQFVNMAAIQTHQIKGGYKAYRQFAADYFEKKFSFLVLSGYTGSGKTEILRALKNAGEQVLDLEALANHKGSVFGGIGQPSQPSTEQFQNELFEALYQMDLSKTIWVEDESIAIGKIFLPSPFWTRMSTSPVVLVEVSRDERVSRLVKEYGTADRDEFLKALKGITKKLGGQHYNAALENVVNGRMPEAIDIILNYYDKAYANSLNRKRDRVRFTIGWNGSVISEFASQLAMEVNSKENKVVNQVN
jgi:tRNA 2-selenouridine synthase